MVLLRKNTEIEVDREDPFANDCLGLKEVAAGLTSLVESAEQSFVLSVEAPWGYGKTSFVTMWKADLESRGHPCVLFNAWETDFVEDPMVALLGELELRLSDLIKQDEKGEVLWQSVRDAGAMVVRKAPGVVASFATLGAVKGKDLEEIWTAYATHGIEGYESAKSSLGKFKKLLQDFSESVVEWEAKKPPMVIFVDELDRCRPDFALQVLERIKHLFSVGRIVFVLSLDRKQLSESAKSLYGAGMEVDGYLRRFIDLSFRLPEPDREAFVEMLFGSFGLNELEYPHGSASTLRRILVEYARRFRLSLREVEQVFTHLNVALRIGAEGSTYFFLPYLLCLGLRHLALYERLVRRDELDLEAVSKFCAPIEEMDETERNIICAGLIGAFVPSGQHAVVLSGVAHDSTAVRNLLSSIGSAMETAVDQVELTARFGAP